MTNSAGFISSGNCNMNTNDMEISWTFQQLALEYKLSPVLESCKVVISSQQEISQKQRIMTLEIISYQSKILGIS